MWEPNRKVFTSSSFPNPPLQPNAAAQWDNRKAGSLDYCLHSSKDWLLLTACLRRLGVKALDKSGQMRADSWTGFRKKRAIIPAF